MRDRHVGSTPRALLPLALIAAGLFVCSSGPAAAGGFSPPGQRGDRPAGPVLFVSPFGEPFVGEPGEPWPVADWFTGADVDLDGAVTWAEFEADGLRWFRRLDADRDGRLNQDELAAYEATLRPFSQGGPRGPRAAVRPEGREADTSGLGEPTLDGPTLAAAPQEDGPQITGRQRGSRGGPRGAPTYGPVAQAGFFNLPQPVKAADVNIDQRVTAEEWAQASRRWFLALDTDQDGRLTLASLPKTPLQLRAEARDR